MNHPLARPLRFTPVHKSYLWGGNQIATRYRRQGLPDVCAESWELSAHPDGESLLAEGPAAGASLAQLAREFGRELLGQAAPTDDTFPLLCKIIDARTSLSVQVHPSAEAAAKLNSESKNESWHLLACEPQATLYAGLRPGTTADSLQAALDAGSAATLMVPHTMSAGDTIFIPSGLVHAIGAGCLLYEVQQSANTTYRLYDWDRVDAQGARRPLHIAEALAAIDWELPLPQPVTLPVADDTWHCCSQTPWFTLRHIRLTRPYREQLDGHSFLALFCASGTCRVAAGDHSVELSAGSSCLLPAMLPTCHLTPLTPATTLLATTL